MYTLVRRFIKTGIAFLFLGLALGAWMLVRRELWGVWPDPYLASAHAHAVLVGFVMFMILGVALWLFPRAAKGDERYTPGRTAAAYWILLVATAGRFLAETGRGVSNDAWLGWVVVLVLCPRNLAAFERRCIRPSVVAPPRRSAATTRRRAYLGRRFDALGADTNFWDTTLGGLGQILGLAVYFWTMWTRVRPVGSHIREARGERF